MKMEKKRINEVYCFQLWHYPPFKVSPLEKLTSIFASSSPTFSDIPSSYLYSIFTMYFSGNSPLLKSFFSIMFSLSCLLTSMLILSLNSSMALLAFSKSSSFSHVLYSAVNPFYLTKYFSTLCCSNHLSQRTNDLTNE